jgi:Bacterial dnaA protein helix-turn-helix
MSRIQLTPDDLARCHAIANHKRDTIRSIMRQVAAKTGITMARLVGPRQDKQTAETRQLCYYIAVRAGMTREEIGEVLGRDQSSVTQGYYAECKRRGETPISLRKSAAGAKMSGPGGVTSAHPGPDHANLYERSETMANVGIIPIPGQKATPLSGGVRAIG